MLVAAYVQAISDADTARAQACWDHGAYYDLSNGCSEICLQRVMGSQLELVSLSVKQASTPVPKRQRRDVRLTVRCADTGAEYQTIITLDAVARDVPWRHWFIVHSDLGGRNFTVDRDPPCHPICTSTQPGQVDFIPAEQIESSKQKLDEITLNACHVNTLSLSPEPSPSAVAEAHPSQIYSLLRW